MYSTPSRCRRWPNTSGRMPCGIAETDDAVARSPSPRPHSRRRNGWCTPVTAANTSSSVGCSLPRCGQFVREHVEQHFRIGIGVDVAQVRFVNLAGAAASTLVRLPLCARVMP